MSRKRTASDSQVDEPKEDGSIEEAIGIVDEMTTVDVSPQEKPSLSKEFPASILLTVDSPQLQCGVCCELMEGARILPCGHSFCLKCVLGLCPDYKLKCPLDQRCFSILNPTMLPKNYAILDIIGELKNCEEETKNHKRQKLVPEDRKNSFLSFLEEILYQRPDYDELFIVRKVQDLPKDQLFQVLEQVMGTQKLRVLSYSFQKAVESYQRKRMIQS